MDSQLLQRRSSYEFIPRFFSPKVESQETRTAADRSRSLCRQRALERIDALILSPDELTRLTDTVCQHAKTPTLTNFEKTLLQKYVKRSGIVCVDRLLDDHKSIQLSYEQWKAVVKTMASDKVDRVMTAQAFVLLSHGHNNTINGLALLEYVYQLHRSLTTIRFLLEQPEGTIDGFLIETDITAIVQRGVSNAIRDDIINISADFKPYYELICGRIVALRHDFRGPRCLILVDEFAECSAFLEFVQLIHPDLHNHFIVENNRFTATNIRSIHRQYLQLDVDKNGMLCADELLEFGKKMAFNPINLTPTHDLTKAFVTQVFLEVKTYPPNDEMDYKTYVDFAVTMADRQSLGSLRFFWNVLDFQKQGFLDAFTLDFFLRDMVQKIREHDGGNTFADESTSASVTQIRTQVFDLVSPRDPLRITWQDLKNCKLGSFVVRLVTDFVAFREYDACDGRFTFS